MQHNVAARAQVAVTGGLRLRKRTVAHLHAMTGKNREYLVTRYGPEMTTTTSQIKPPDRHSWKR